MNTRAALIEQRPRPEFVNAVGRSLPAGEKLTDFVDVYEEQWSQKWNDLLKRWMPHFDGLNWYSLVLTNLAIRLVNFRTEKIKTGLLSREHRVIPELAGAMAAPIGQISTTALRSFQPQKPVVKLLRRTISPDVHEVSAINIRYANGFLDVGSPFRQLVTLHTNLENFRNGALLASQTANVESAVSKLGGLLREGLISQTEFDAAKAGFIGTTTQVAESAISTLRQLYSLYKSGVLTQSEFNMKKWDVLSRTR